MSKLKVCSFKFEQHFTVSLIAYYICLASHAWHVAFFGNSPSYMLSDEVPPTHNAHGLCPPAMDWELTVVERHLPVLCARQIHGLSIHWNVPVHTLLRLVQVGACGVWDWWNAWLCTGCALGGEWLCGWGQGTLTFSHIQLLHGTVLHDINNCRSILHLHRKSWAIFHLFAASHGLIVMMVMSASNLPQYLAGPQRCCHNKAMSHMCYLCFP